MEKIKVNMSPNPLDVQTIHASQNDGEARQWEFELHNNGELIDTSDVKEQLVFKAYKGGTEQLLPENGSTPTTSPFLGDIRYPQGLLTDQEFTYRESPTESDGLAKLTDIKGNTLVWNQLVKNGNFADGKTDWTERYATLSVTNNICRATFTGQAWNNDIRQTASFPSGHKYFISLKYRASASRVGDLNLIIASGGTQGNNFKTLPNVTTMTSTSFILTPTSNVIYWRLTLVNDQSANSGEFIEATDFMAIDLTQMGLDITDPSDFTSLFPLSYYSYNQGSLLSFNGNGIKTVGKNQIKLSADALVSSQRIGINYLDNGAVFTANGTYSRAGYTCKTIKGQQYTLSFKGFSNANFGAVYISNDLDWNTKYGRINLGRTEENKSLTFTADSELFFVGFYLTNTGTSGSMTIKDIQLELGPSVTPYEPYTSSTLSLPISTYFPNGMKSAGNVYDELTESKAITRVGTVDLGSLTYTMYQVTQGNLFRASAIADAKLTYDSTNIRCALYPTLKASERTDKCVCVGTVERIDILDSSFSDANAFKTAMSGVYLYYELVTPTETSFSTASLVTENAEIPLSNEDGVLIGKCTEQLSENPGFIDAKIKLSDADGECYSNKIQLHVERSPQ